MTQRVLSCTLTGCLVACTLPAAASASTVEVRGKVSTAVRYVAGPGERNDLSILEIEGSWPTAFVVHDPGAAISAGAGCVTVDAHTAVCAETSGSMYHIVVALGDGDDVLRPAGFQLVRADGGPGADRLFGGTWDDRLDGGGGLDELRGGAGADVLSDGDREDAPSDADVLDAGTGRDRISYEHRAAPVNVDLSDPGVDGAEGEADQLTGFEDITGGRGNDRLVGDDRANGIESGGGHDEIAGRGGNDAVVGAREGTVDCGHGKDTVRGVTSAVMLTRSCEAVLRGVDDDEFVAAAYPSHGGELEVTCTEYEGEPLSCGGTVTLSEASGARRLLAGGLIPAGVRRRVAHLRLTATARRLLRRGPIRATVRLRGDVPHLAWTILLR